MEPNLTKENYEDMALSSVNEKGFCKGLSPKVQSSKRDAIFEYSVLIKCFDTSKEDAEKAAKQSAIEAEEIRKSDLAKKERIKLRIEKTKECSAGKIDMCEDLLTMAHVDNDIDSKYFALSRLCYEYDDVELNYCYELVALAKEKKSPNCELHGSRIGCKYLEGKLCSNFFQILKKNGHKAVALEVLELTSSLLKDECTHGFNESCIEMENLASKCYSDSHVCKAVKLFVNNMQIESQKEIDRIANDERRFQEVLSIEKQKAEDAKRAEERRAWSEMANQINSSFNKLNDTHKSNNISCTSIPSPSGAVYTNCH